MNNPQLRKPLLQAGIVLAVFCILILFVSNAHPTNLFEAISAVFCGIFTTIVFVIGIIISLTVAIGVLVAIFFAGLKLYSSEQASTIYSEFKTRLFEMGASYADSFYCSCTNQPPTSRIPTEELEQLKKSLSQAEIEKQHLEKGKIDLQEEFEDNKAALEKQETVISSLQDDKEVLHQELSQMKEQAESAEKQNSDNETLITSLKDENIELKSKVTQLETQLKEAEQHTESAPEQDEPPEELVEENRALKETVQELKVKIKELEEDAEKSPEAAIFSYIEDEAEKDLLASKAREIAGQDLTYAQMDEALTKELPAHLDKILKEHPSLTKTYLRNLRREAE